MINFIRRLTSTLLVSALLFTSIDVNVFADNNIVEEFYSEDTSDTVSFNAPVVVLPEHVDNVRQSDYNSSVLNSGAFNLMLLEDGIAWVRNNNLLSTAYKCVDGKMYFYGSSTPSEFFDNALGSTVGIKKLGAYTNNSTYAAGYNGSDTIFAVDNNCKNISIITKEGTTSKTYITPNPGKFGSSSKDVLNKYIMVNSYGYAVAGTHYTLDRSNYYDILSTVYYYHNGTHYSVKVPYSASNLNVSGKELANVYPILTKDNIYIVCTPYHYNTTCDGLKIFKAAVGTSSIYAFEELDLSGLKDAGFSDAQLKILSAYKNVSIETIKGTNDFIINNKYNKMTFYYDDETSSFTRLSVNGTYCQAYLAANSDNSVVTLTSRQNGKEYTRKITANSDIESYVDCITYNDSIICYLNADNDNYVAVEGVAYDYFYKRDNNIFMSWADNLFTSYPSYTPYDPNNFYCPIATGDVSTYVSPYKVGDNAVYRLGIDGNGDCSEGYILNTELDMYEYVGELEHDLERNSVTESPDCMTPGTYTNDCTRCGYSTGILQDDVIIGPHAPINTKVVREPTCTSVGMRDTICSICNKEVPDFTYHHSNGEIDSLITDFQIPALGHNFTSYVTNKEPTCTRSGSMTRICSNCGVDEVVLEPLGHSFCVKDVVTESTCSQVGVCTMECTRCGLIINNCDYEIKPHNFEASNVEYLDPNNNYYDYEYDDYTEKLLCKTTLTCTDCSYSYLQENMIANVGYEISTTAVYPELLTADNRGSVDVDTITFADIANGDTIPLSSNSEFTMSTQTVGILDESFYDSVKINNVSIKEFLGTDLGPTVARANSYSTYSESYGWYLDKGINYMDETKGKYQSLQAMAMRNAYPEYSYFVDREITDRNTVYFIMKATDTVDSVIGIDYTGIDCYGNPYPMINSLLTTTYFYKLNNLEGLNFTSEQEPTISADVRTGRDNYYLVVTSTEDGFIDNDTGVYGVILSTGIDDTTTYTSIPSDRICVDELYTNNNYTLDKAATIKVTDADRYFVQYKGISHTPSDGVDNGFTLVKVPIASDLRAKEITNAYGDKQYEFDYSKVYIPSTDFAATIPYYEWYLDGCDTPLENGDVVDGVEYKMVGSELQAYTLGNINEDKVHNLRCVAYDYQNPQLGSKEFSCVLHIENVEANVDVIADAGNNDDIIVTGKTVQCPDGSLVTFKPSTNYYVNSSEDTWEVTDSKPTWYFTDKKGIKYKVVHSNDYLQNNASAFSLFREFLGKAGNSENTIEGYIDANNNLTIKLVDDGTLECVLDARYGNDSDSYAIDVAGNDVELSRLIATYKGEDVFISNNYNKDDVEVVAYYSDDTSVTLNSDDWSVDTTLVSVVGKNTYTAKYSGLEADFYVNGLDKAISISAVYKGSPIYIDNVYNKDDVEVTVTFESGVTTLLEPHQWSASSIQVANVGANNFTCTYSDLECDYSVLGYKEDSITSVYTGPDISVGGKYSKDDVTVTVKYTTDDIAPVVLSSSDWVADSLDVLIAGVNNYTATYKGLTSNYSVIGIDIPKRELLSIKAEYKGADIEVGSNYNKDDVVVTASYSIGSDVTLSSTDWTESSLIVQNVGDNAYTATYQGCTAPYTVKGYKPLTAVGLMASYLGDSIEVGKEYDKDEVAVYAIMSDGSNIELSSDEWTASSLKVSVVGSNSYIASYKGLTADYYVSGIDIPEVVLSSLKAEYKGKDILVGNNYAKKDVTVTATYSNGNSIIVPVDDWECDSLLVKNVGSNKYIASYGGLTASYSVTGYANVVESITAQYLGDKVVVGNDYLKSDVLVTAYYTDGTNIVLKQSEWDASSLLVEKVGKNSYIATYNGKKAEYTVKGYNAVESITAKYLGDDIEVGSKYNKSDVLVKAIYSDGSSKVLAKSDWKASSLEVTKVGKNTYTAKYKGKKAKYNVKGFTPSIPEPTPTPTPDPEPTPPPTPVIHTGVSDNTKYGIVIIGFGILMFMYAVGRKRD